MEDSSVTRKLSLHIPQASAHLFVNYNQSGWEIRRKATHYKATTYYLEFGISKLKSSLKATILGSRVELTCER